MKTFLVSLSQYLMLISFIIKIMVNLVTNYELDYNHNNENELKRSDSYLKLIEQFRQKSGDNVEDYSKKLRKRSEDLKSMRISSLEESLSEVSNDYKLNVAFSVNCSELLLGQYKCWPPVINPETQQPIGCNSSNKAFINCTLAEGLVCDKTSKSDFLMTIDCEHTNGYSYETALLLSIFLGMFGADRFYLGYPALGLLKFCTLGFLFFGQLIDIILIAMQIVRPADGSYYVIKYFGPKLDIISFNNNTDIVFNDELTYYIT